MNVPTSDPAIGPSAIPVAGPTRHLAKLLQFSRSCSLNQFTCATCIRMPTGNFPALSSVIYARCWMIITKNS